jgi:BirA family transcriptional regulator, biotin operon repressor / biotin---[acetyl-CoA-carboxylase] ligase
VLATPAHRTRPGDRTRRLRQHGHMTGSPYTDLSRPPLREGVLSRGLVVPDGLWTQVRVVAETGSTNADLAEAARTGAGEGLVLIAERQRAGRGRLDRSWQAPERSAITMSVLLRPPVPTARLGWLPLLAGVALVDAIDRVGGVEAHLKWPNDLLLGLGAGGFGKAAGILAEAVDGAVVLGLGLNVSQRADELPPPSDPRAYPPTSLALAGGPTDRVPLVRATLRSVEHWYARWRDAGGDPDASGLRAAYRSHCVTIGLDVAVSLPGGGELVGNATDVDADGRLVVMAGDGVHTLAAGDVRHIR